MLFIRLSCVLMLLLGAACNQPAETRMKLTESAKSSFISKLSISRYDEGIKSICLDSSGFYYICCDTGKIHDSNYQPKRINLSKYTNELKLFQSFDTLYFSKLDKSIGLSCGISKEPFTVLMVADGHEYSFHPGICASYSSTSSFYKLQLVKDFFVQLKQDF